MSARRSGALNPVEVARRLPHRHPFLLLDRVDDLKPGVSAVGTKNVSITDPVFAGHFPANPIYPGVHMVEVAAQLCGLIGSSEGEAPMLGYLASIKRFKFLALVVPGDQMTITARAGVSIGALTEYTVEITVARTVVASGVLSIARTGA
ncbi:3-hydroxyacyl-ACP dehydratase FabZ [uncultured Microbacterium sp.]|uniref:3-hydroxyacyl-ACP dehydratase FabZ n=1 Tax=uncultured Microbacterium sp. TaxID=191216 RepID=UPI0028D3F25D|nr:3-hydroxyacyl-ACP dehydratase FabZ [uncultured Microbacterium sp.]